MDQLAFALSFTGGVAAPTAAQAAAGNVARATTAEEGYLTYNDSPTDLLRDAQDFPIPETTLAAGSLAWVVLATIPITTIHPVTGKIRSVTCELAVDDATTGKTGLVTIHASVKRVDAAAHEVTNRDDGTTATVGADVTWSNTLIEADAVNAAYGDFYLRASVTGSDFVLEAQRLTGGARTVREGGIWYGRVR